MTEFQPTPQTPEQVATGLRDAFRQAIKDGVFEMTEINLSYFVNEKVQVTFQNGKKYKGEFEYCHLLSSASFPYVFWGDNGKGDHYNKNGVNAFAEAFGNSHNIVQIERIKPMTKTDISKVLIEGEYATIMGVKYKRVEEPKPQTLYEYFNSFGIVGAEGICNIVAKWLPDEVEVDTEEYNVGWNDCLQKIKENLL